MSDKEERDRFLERAREEAEGVEVYEDTSDGRALEVEAEEAQGVEVFQDPDSIVPASDLKEGAPGHETLTKSHSPLDPDEDEWRTET